MESRVTEETVRLRVPATLEYVRLVRLTTSGVASRLGFDVDEIEDLRVAVDELASVVIELAGDGPLDVQFSVDDGSLHIAGEALLAVQRAGNGARAATRATVEELTEQILAAVVDEWDVRFDGERVRFCCVRRIPEHPAP